MKIRQPLATQFESTTLSWSFPLSPGYPALMSDNGLKDLAEEHKLEQDNKREVDQKHKWALGEELPTRGHPSKRPAKPYSAR